MEIANGISVVQIGRRKEDCECHGKIVPPKVS